MSFAVHDLDQGEAAASRSMITADVDSDGDLDIVSNNIWRENLDGKGTFGVTRPFANDDYEAKELEAVDVDGDGDLDLVALTALTANPNVFDLLVFENRDGRGDYGRPQVIDTTLPYSYGFEAGDIDNDRDVDLVLKTSDGQLSTIHWYENTDGRGAFLRIRQTQGKAYGNLQLLDVDMDGDLDLITASADYENTDGKGTFKEKDLVPNDWKQTFRDTEGILNVLTDGFLYKRLPSGTFSRNPVRPCPTNEMEAELVQVIDLNGDGVLDRLTLIYLSPARDTNAARLIWCQSPSGATQELGLLDNSYLQPLLVEDVTGDGVRDIVYGTAYRPFDLGTGRFGPEVALMSPTWTRSVNDVQLADFDGDGDLDSLSLATGYEYNQDWSFQTISWSENLDGRGTFGPRKQIGHAAASGMLSERRATTNVFVVDVDNDQDLDVVYESMGSHTGFNVLTNVDGRGRFSSKFYDWPLEDRFKGLLWDVRSLEGGGRADLLFLSEEGVSVKRATGDGKFGPLETLVRAPDLFANALPRWILVPMDFNVQLVDWDRDGDLDLMGINQQFEVAWWENLNNGTQFGPRVPLFTANFDSIPYQSVGLSVADLDNDRDLDVMLAAAICERSCNATATRWFANIDGRTFGPAVPISDTIRRPRVVDMDDDGDLDVLGEDISEADIFHHERLDAAWYENVGGTGMNWTRNEIAAGRQWVVATGDIDGDRDVDILAPNLKWYEQRLSGDINNDGQFSSSDLVLAFQAGHFETDVPGRAQFHQGDFNGDGNFNSADLIFAYQAGRYEKVFPFGN